MPVGDGLGSTLIRVDSSELGKRHGHIAVVPADQHQHIVSTGIFRRQAEDLDRISFAEWRDYFGSNSPGGEGKLDLVLQVVVPAESLFFRSIGVDDDFVMDSFLAHAVLSQLGHGYSIRGLTRTSMAQASASVYLRKTPSMRSQSWSSCS